MRALPSISRRQALIGGLCLCCAPALGRDTRNANAKLVTEEIAPGIHIRRGLHETATAENLDSIANIGFVIGRDKVAVMDAGGSLKDGQRLRARIREVTALPIGYVLMSHVHPDHIFGASAFLEDKPEFVGHAALPNALAQRGEYYRARLEDVLGEGEAGEIVQPTLLVEKQVRLDLGARALELTAHPIAHTDNDLSALDVKTRTLFPSDLLFVQRVPSLDGSLKGWLNELRQLSSQSVARAVPGHGPISVDFQDAATKLQTYLEALLRDTRQAIASGQDIDTAPDSVALSERHKWSLFEEYHGHNVTQAFKELEWE